MACITPGTCLLQAIAEVIGEEDATDDVDFSQRFDDLWAFTHTIHEHGQ